MRDTSGNDIPQEFLKGIDKSKFVNDPYVKRVEKPWGFELHFTPQDYPYMTKILHVDEGKRLSLQIHDEKMETWVLFSGEIIMEKEGRNGEMVQEVMQPLVSYTNQKGQKHRIIGGKGGGEVFEASTPEIGKTYRLEDDYARPTETEEMRKDPNRGWEPS